MKGWIAGFLGLLIAMIGHEGIYAFPRFAYGSTDLAGGIGLLPALVGAFGFSEVLSVMKSRRPRPCGRDRPDDPAARRHRPATGARSSARA